MKRRFSTIQKTLIVILCIMVVAFSYKLFFASPNDSSDDFLAQNRSRYQSRQSQPAAPRDYWAELNEAEKKDMTYIITTLSSASYVSLVFKEKSLKDAGDRVEHVHPLKFLRFIFSDPKLKKDVKKIQGTVWRRFNSDTAESMDKEAKLGNMKEAYLKDYSEAVGVDEKVLQPSFQNNQWQEFINATRDNLPSN